ncbi:MAG: hypothetical protein HZB26_20190 [Candidatus Hydrogenedentes bacterium]|nr:hypothetical protein [Candidatus Hydrogenedentota bacterium]
MKTAYELAMERLEKDSGSTKKLSDAQRARLAEIEKKYDAKIAEARLQYDDRAAAAKTVEEFDAARATCADQVARLESQRDKEKDAVWNEG